MPSKWSIVAICLWIIGIHTTYAQIVNDVLITSENVERLHRLSLDLDGTFVGFIPSNEKSFVTVTQTEIEIWEIEADHSIVLARTIPLRLSEHETILNIANEPDSSSLSSDGQYLAVPIWDSTQTPYAYSLRIINLDTGEEDELLQLATFNSFARDLAFSPDARWLAQSSDDETALWDLTEWGMYHRLMNSVSSDENDEVYRVAFSPDSTLVAAGYGSGRIYDRVRRIIAIWNTESQTLAGTLPGHIDVLGLAFHPTEDLLVSSGRDRRVVMWDIDTFSQIAEYELDDSFVTDLSFSPDGTLLAGSTSNGRIYLWEVRELQLRVILDSESNALQNLEFSPSGTLLATTLVEDIGRVVNLWLIPGEN